MAEGFLREVYLLSQAIESINQHYYDGLQSMFPELAQDLDHLVSSVEEVVGIYNRGIAEDLEFLDRLLKEPDSEEPKAPITMDLASLTQQSRKSNNGLITSLVDMAKAEALSHMGETGKALELVERHIPKDTTNPLWLALWPRGPTRATEYGPSVTRTLRQSMASVVSCLGKWRGKK